jgi:flagellar M-ring protein FliF
VVGPGRARVQLSADFDFNRITETFDKFDPEGRVLRSSQTREETSATATSEAPVSVGNELPAAAPNPAANPTTPRESNRKSEEIVNYEISRATKTEVTEGGRVKRISAAVLVDGSYTKNDKGDVTYQPRSKEELDRIGALVRSAIGFDQKRGDQVEIVNLRFAEAPAQPIQEASGWLSFLQFTKDDIMRAIELVVMGLLGLVVILFVVRPLVRRIVTPDEGRIAPPAPAALPAVAPAPALPEAAPSNAPTSETAKMIDMAQVQGQVHAQSIQKVGELAERNPHETVAIVRQWLQDAPA